MAVIAFSTASLERALARLQEALEVFHRDTKDTIVRDALVKRFEYVYGQCVTTMTRFLEYASANPTEIGQYTFQQIIRMANEQGLLMGNWEEWKEYRTMRGKTSHMYDEEVAMDVVDEIPDFIDEVKYLCSAIGSKLT